MPTYRWACASSCFLWCEVIHTIHFLQSPSVLSHIVLPSLSYLFHLCKNIYYLFFINTDTRAVFRREAKISLMSPKLSCNNPASDWNGVWNLLKSCFPGMWEHDGLIKQGGDERCQESIQNCRLTSDAYLPCISLTVDWNTAVLLSLWILEILALCLIFCSHVLLDLLHLIFLAFFSVTMFHNAPPSWTTVLSYIPFCE